MERKNLQIYYLDENGKEQTFPKGMRPATVTNYTFTAQRMGAAPQLTGTMYYPTCLDDLWAHNEYVVFRGEKYYVDQIGSSSKGNENALYNHSLIFASERLILDDVYFYDVVVEDRTTAYGDRVRSNGTKFSTYCDIHEFASRLTDSMIYRGLCKYSRDKDGNETFDGYHVVFDDETTVSDTEELSFDKKTLSEAIQEIYNTFELNYYWVGKTLHIGDQSKVLDTVFEYGRETGLLSFGRTNSNAKIITRMTGVGSSDNLQSYYPNDTEYGTIFYDVSGFDKSQIKYLSYPKLVAQGVDVDNGDTITYTSKECDFKISYESIFNKVSQNPQNPNPNSSHNLHLYQGNIEKEGAWYKKDGNENYYGWFEVEKVKVTIHAKGTGGVIDFSPYAYFGDKLGNGDGSYINVEEEKDENGETKSVTTTIKISNFAWAVKSSSEIGTFYKEQRAFDFVPDEEVNGLNAIKYFKIKSEKEITSDNVTMRTPWGFGIIDSVNKVVFEDDSERDITLEFLFFASKVGNFPTSIIGYEDSEWFQKFYFAHTYAMPSSYFFAKKDGTLITYVNSGVRFNDNTEIPTGSTITFKGREFYPTCDALMPSIYRDTKGKERFYEATNAPKERYTEIYDSYVTDGTIEIKDDDDQEEFDIAKAFAINLYKDGDSYHTFNNPFDENHPHEHVETFSDIRVGIENVTNNDGDPINEIVDVGFDDDDNDEKDDDGSFLHPYFYIKLHRFNGEGLTFNLFECASNTGKMQINMTSGTCAGCCFEVAAIKQADRSGDGYYTFKNGVQINKDGTLAAGNMTSVDGASGKWNASNLISKQQFTNEYEVWIAVRKDVETYGVVIPNQVNNYRPKKGDTFNITGINLPKEYIIAAERKLSEAIVEYIEDNNDEKFTPTLKFSQVYLQTHPDIENILDENVSLKVKYNGHILQYHVSTFTCKAENSSLCEISVDLVEDLTSNTGSLRSAVGQIAKEYFLSNSTLRAITNSIAGSSLSADDVLSIVKGNFISKTDDDTAAGLITFLKGIALGSGGEYTISSDGKAVLSSLQSDTAIIKNLASMLGDLLVMGNTKLQGNVTSSIDFSEQTSGTWGITDVDANGINQKMMAIDRLYVRAKAVFEELEIRRLSYTGGNRVASPAGSKITKIEKLDSSGNVISDLDTATSVAAYKCYLHTDDGDTATQNGWKKDDIACLQEFNVTSHHLTNVSNRVGMWIVTEAGQNSYNADGELLSQSYIILGNLTGQHSGTDAPQAQDILVSKGNLSDTDRDNYIIERTNGTDAPSYEMYAGVHSFSDIDNPERRTAILSPRLVQFRTNKFSLIDYDGVKRPVTINRGAYDPTATYNYYNIVSYEGSLWLLDNIDPSTSLTGIEPSAINTQWTRQTDHNTINQGATGADTTYLKIAPSGATQFVADSSGTVDGEVTLTAHVYYGTLEITDAYDPSDFTWEIDGEIATPNAVSKTIKASSITDSSDHVRCYLSDEVSQPTLLADHEGNILTDSNGNPLTK